MRDCERQSNSYYRDNLSNPVRSFWFWQLVDRSAAAMARAMVEAGEFTASDRVVEVGPGLGGYIVALADSGVLASPPAVVELSREMIDRLVPRLQRAGHSDIRVIEGSGVDLAHLVESASVVVSYGMVKHLDDDSMRDFFTAVRDVLGPRGRFFLGEIVPGRGPFARRIEREMGEGSLIRPEQELVAALCDAGFDMVEQTPYGRSLLPAKLTFLRARTASTEYPRQ